MHGSTQDIVRMMSQMTVSPECEVMQVRPAAGGGMRDHAWPGGGGAGAEGRRAGSVPALEGV